MKKNSWINALCVTLLVANTLFGQNKNDLKNRDSGYRGDFLKNLSTPDSALNFLVIGDWGRCGEFFQKEVGEQLANASMSGEVSFIISTGDNFYPSGVASVDDPLWNSSYENVYRQFALQKPWYVVLGNHDYKTNPQAEIDYSKKSARWVLPSRYYSKKIAIHGDTNKKVLFVFMDTSPFINKYYVEEDYREHVKTQDTLAQLRWLDATLSDQDPAIVSKIVIGHHPLYTSGKRMKSQETIELRKRLEPIMKKNKVTAYLCGHEHHLEYAKPEGITHHFISGAGSESREIKGELPESKFKAMDHGFMLFSLTPDTLKAQIINWQGIILYQQNISIK